MDPCGTLRLHNTRKQKGTTNMNKRLSIGQIAVKPIDLTRGKSSINKLTKE
jgi:hypothetical protein